MNRRLFAAASIGLLLGFLLGMSAPQAMKNRTDGYVIGIGRWALLVLSALGLACCWWLHKLVVYRAPNLYRSTEAIRHPILTEAETSNSCQRAACAIVGEPSRDYRLCFGWHFLVPSRRGGFGLTLTAPNLSRQHRPHQSP